MLFISKKHLFNDKSQKMKDFTMSIISRSEFLAKINAALQQGLKLLVGKEVGKGGGGRPVVFLKDDKLEWYINTLKIDSTNRFGNVENLLHRELTGRIVSIDSSLLEKVIAPSYSSMPVVTRVATVIETEKRKPGRPKAAAKVDTPAFEVNATEKRKPGRPKAAAKVDTPAVEANATEKRKPGRPKAAIKVDTSAFEVNTIEKRKPGRPKATANVEAPALELSAEKRKPGRPKIATKVEAPAVELFAAVSEKRKPGRPKAVAELHVEAPVAVIGQVTPNINVSDLALALDVVAQMSRSSWKKSAILAVLNARD